MEYINPFSMVPASSDFDSTNFLSVMNAQHKMDMARPFIDMARQGQELDLQQQAMKAGEFASPLAQDARRTGLQKQVAENTAATRVAPERANFDIEKYRQDLRSLPAMTDQKIAEAEQAAMKARGTPMETFFKQMGDLQGALEQAPEGMRPMLYSEGIRRWQMQHPGAQLPPEMQQYNPANMKLLRYAQIYTSGHMQKLSEIKQQGVNSENVARINADSAARVATIHEAGQDRRSAASLAAQQGKNPAAEKVRLTRILNNKDSTPDQLEEAQGALEMLATEEFNKTVVRHDRGLAALELQSIRAMNDPDKSKEVMARIDARKNELWKDHLIKWGVRVKVKAPNGQTGTILRSELRDYTRQGYKEIK